MAKTQKELEQHPVAKLFPAPDAAALDALRKLKIFSKHFNRSEEIMRNKKKGVIYESNLDKRNVRVTAKSFLKAELYHVNYSNSKFLQVSFKNAHIKFSAFYSASFSKVDFSGANLRGSNFTSAHFTDVIFSNTNLDKANFSDAHFTNVYFLCTNTERAKNFPSDKTGIIFLSKAPAESEFSEDLLTVADKANTNEIIRASHVLYGKGKRNTLALKILSEAFSEEELIKRLLLATSKASSPITNIWDFQKYLAQFTIEPNSDNNPNA